MDQLQKLMDALYGGIRPIFAQGQIEDIGGLPAEEFSRLADLIHTILDPAQKLIRDGGTVGLVDMLEISQIQSNQRQGDFLAARPGEQRSEFSVVVSACQVIIPGQLLQLLLGAGGLLTDFLDAVIKEIQAQAQDQNRKCRQ